MKILITGGAGFIGSNIADGYVAQGYEVVVVDNLSSGKKDFLDPTISFHQADITDKEAITKIITSEKPDIINHHAAQISVRHSVEDPAHDAQLNIIGLLHVMEAARTAGVKKVIFASSGGAIYGNASQIPTAESYHPFYPLSPYGITKFSTELYLHYYYETYHIPYVALRYSNVYGPRQNPHGEAGVVAIFTKKMLKGESPTINGEGKQTRDYVFVGDVVAANVAAVPTPFVGACNVGTGVETDVVTIFEELKKAMQKDMKPVFGPAKMGEQARSCLNTKKAKEVLGWEAKISFSHGLQKTIEFFQTHE